MSIVTEPVSDGQRIIDAAAKKRADDADVLNRLESVTGSSQGKEGGVGSKKGKKVVTAVVPLAQGGAGKVKEVANPVSDKIGWRRGW